MFVFCPKAFPSREGLGKVAFCNATCLGIRFYIDVVVGILAEHSALHGLGNDVAHLKETATVFQEAAIHDFVGGIHDARHVTALVDGLEGQCQTTELLQVRLEEL